jgi:serine/threonine protein kinase
MMLAYDAQDLQESYAVGQVACTDAFREERHCTNRRSGAQRTVSIYQAKNMHKEDRTNFVKEMHSLMELDSRNLQNVCDVFKDETRHYIVSERCPGSDLLSEIVDRKVLSEREVVSIIHSILKTLDYCHGAEVIHKNLRPETLRVERGQDYATLKVVEFCSGSARTSKAELFDESYGFPHYASP